MAVPYLNGMTPDPEHRSVGRAKPRARGPRRSVIIERDPGPPAGPAASITAAQVIGSFAGGGAERLAYNLAVGLGVLGARSYAVALRGTGLIEPTPPCVGILELGATPRDRRAALAAMARFRRFVIGERINVVHVHGMASLPFCAMALVGAKPRPRLLFTWHTGEGVLRTGSKRLLRWAMSRCDRVYGPSAAVAAELSQRVALRRPAAVFRNGVEVLPASAGGADGPVIVWAGRMVPTKDPRILLRAAATLRREGLRFRIVLAGSAPLRMQWYADGTRELAAELGLADVVEMPGWVHDTASLYDTGTIGVQSSTIEGLSLALLEQMMAGLAVVATDVGDTSEAVIDGRTGLLIPHSDEPALTGALRRLLRDPALTAQLGRSARGYALREFTIARMAERAVDEYVEALELAPAMAAG